MRNLCLAAFGFCAVIGNGAHAADATGSAALYGLGGLKCQAVAQDASFGQDGPRRQALMSWLLGYLSASNVERAGTFDLSPITDQQSIYQIFYTDCKSHPAYLVQESAARVIGYLANAKIRDHSPTIVIANDFGSVVVREAVVLQIQDSLAKMKLFKGYIDGKSTLALQASIKIFQAANKLNETGLPDPATILRLIVDPARRNAAGKVR